MHSKPRCPLISIVIPTLNEAENIGPLFTRLFEVLHRQTFDAEVVVVDDGSADGTRDRVREWVDSHPVRLVERGREGGLSGAVLAGAEAAKGQVVVVMDADLSHPPSKVPALVEPILCDEADMVVGSRYVAGGSTPGWPVHRRLMSRAASWLAWPIVDIRDPMSGLFAVRREHLLRIGLKADGFKIGLELLAGGAESLRVLEVPIQFQDREHGESKLGTGVVRSYLERLRALAGGSVSTLTVTRFAVIGAAGMILDMLCFTALLAGGIGLSAAHLWSFIAATAFNYTFNATWSFASMAGQDVKSWRRYTRFLVVAVLALMLRGAVLGSMVEVWNWPRTGAIFVAILAAGLVNYLGSAFYVFPEAGVRPELRWRVATVGVVGYIIALRLFYLGLPDLMMEEAYYWNYAQHPALGYLDHPPMVAWLIWLGTYILGNIELGVRIGAFVCWCITGLFGYLMARDVTDKSTALRAVLLLAVLPFFFFTGLMMTPDAPLTACWAGALYFLQRALLGEHRHAWWGVGLCVGLGMLSKYTIALLGPATLIFMLMDRRSLVWLRRPQPYLAALLASAVFSPVIIWNMQNHWASFVFQSVRRLEEKPEFGLPLLIGSVFLLLTPFGLIAAVKVLTQRRSRTSDASDPREDNRRLRFATAYTLVPFAVFFLFSLRHDPKLNWTGPLWLAIVPFIAGDLMPKQGEIVSAASAAGRRIWRPTIVVCMLGYGVFLHYISLGFPGVPYPQDLRLVGWADLAKQIESIGDEIEQRVGIKPIVVGMDHYSIASHLAFYRTSLIQVDEPLSDKGITHTSGRHLFGGGDLMFEQWFPIDKQIGTTMIVIDDEVSDLESPSVTDCFERMSPLKRIIVHNHGRYVSMFYYRIGYGYSAPAG